MADSNSPIYPSIYNYQSLNETMSMTGHSADEFNSMWSCIIDYCSNNWIAGRGRRSEYKGKDTFFYGTLCAKSWQ